MAAMLPVLLARCCVLLPLLASTTAMAAAPPGSPVALHGALHVAGTRIVDARARPVALHGMSLFWSQWQPQFYDPAIVDWLADDWRVDVVRAAIAAADGGYATEPAVETRRAETVIDAAIAKGVYVLVDWHAHRPMAAEATAFFTHIAQKYRGVPNLIYETWNEPLPQYGWADVIKPYHRTVIAAIRAQDPQALVIAGTRSWSQDVDEAAADPLPEPNVAYTLHFYAASHKQGLRDKADRALKRGVALFVTEYGTTAANGDGPIDEAETRRWWAWCDANQIGYVNWSVAAKAEASAALLPGTPARAHWQDERLSRSGMLVRARLRADAESR